MNGYGHWPIHVLVLPMVACALQERTAGNACWALWLVTLVIATELLRARTLTRSYSAVSSRLFSGTLRSLPSLTTSSFAEGGSRGKLRLQLLGAALQNDAIASQLVLRLGTEVSRDGGSRPE